MAKYVDYDNLDRFYGNIADRPVQAFDTVADMQAATHLEAGMTCHTNGFHASGDGGAAYYTVSASGTANGMDVLALQGSLVATLVVTEPYVTPEQFGAYGDGTHDDTSTISACIGYAYTNRLSVRFENARYIVSGDNPCGVKREIPTDSRETYERGITIDFGLAVIEYRPANEDDCFAFVGYCRRTTIQNLQLNVVPPTGHSNYGDVFSTRFKISGAQHEFSGNIFTNIRVSGTCRRMFNFECGNDELQTHDDLSLFIRVGGSGFKAFYYTDNSNSVANTFLDCTTNQNVDNSIAFHIACTSWGSGLRIRNHHFTLMDCDSPTMLKMSCRNTPYATVYIDMPRTEIRNTATNWKYFDIAAGVAYFGDMMSINYPTYSASNVYGILGLNASAYFTGSYGVYTPFNLIGGKLSTGTDSASESLIFDRCTFVNGNSANARRAYPLINYCDDSGNVLANRVTALQSYSYGDILIKDSTSDAGNYSRDRWFEDYDILNGMHCMPDTQVRHRALYHRPSSNGTRTVSCGSPFIVPFDIVITSLVWKQSGSYNLQNQINNMRIEFPNGEFEAIRTNLTGSAMDMSLIPAGKELYLPAGTSFRVNMYATDTLKTETNFIDSSWLNIEYRVPATPIDYTRIATGGLNDSYGI